MFLKIRIKCFLIKICMHFNMELKLMCFSISVKFHSFVLNFIDYQSTNLKVNFFSFIALNSFGPRENAVPFFRSFGTLRSYYSMFIKHFPIPLPTCYFPFESSFWITAAHNTSRIWRLLTTVTQGNHLMRPSSNQGWRRAFGRLHRRKKSMIKRS